MSSLADLAGSGIIAAGPRPWRRAAVDREAWNLAIARLAEGAWSLAGLWGDRRDDRAAVHMALYDPPSDEFAIVTLDCPEGTFPSVGRLHAPAIRLERAIRDLWGLTPAGAPDDRPWLDHGKWRRDEAASHINDAARATYPFLPAEGENLHQVAVGPVHAGIIEPGHFRFTASGETVVRLEERLGYVHKGVEALMSGADAPTALTLAERVSGDSTIAYALAFSRAVEAALGVRAPPRADFLRALALELERIANHLGDFGAVCNDAAFALVHSHCAILREEVLRAAEAAFGSRLMRGFVAPGGVSADPSRKSLDDLMTLAGRIERRLELLNRTYEETSSLQDRTVGTGRVLSGLVAEFAAGGYVGRASGRKFDARKAQAFAPYDTLAFDAVAETAGDVDARVKVRIREIGQSIRLIRQIIGGLPQGETIVSTPGAGREAEGAALVEGFRGDVLAYARLSVDGRIDRCHLRDPSWFQWPLLEAAIEGNIIADFPLCNKSFNCSYSGHDL